MIHAREYQQLMKKVLERVGFFDALPRREEYTPCAAPQLHREHPRLMELQQEYEAYASNARAHSQWSKDFTEAIDLAAFRGDSNFMWQYRDANVPLTYAATYYHHLLSGRSDLLEQCTEDRAFGVFGISIQDTFVTRDRLDSVAELDFLRKTFDLSESSTLRILDIGSGYGRLPWRFAQCFPNAEVLGVDAVPESAFLCEFYLRFREAPGNVRMVTLPKLNAALDYGPPDLAVAFNSLSECSSDAVSWWLALLADHKVPYLVVVPHSGFDGGRQLLTTEQPGVATSDMTRLLARHGFYRIALREKYTEPAMQRYGISPTWFHVFSRKGAHCA